MRSRQGRVRRRCSAQTASYSAGGPVALRKAWSAHALPRVHSHAYVFMLQNRVSWSATAASRAVRASSSAFHAVPRGEHGGPRRGERLPAALGRGASPGLCISGRSGAGVVLAYRLAW